ncbi:AsmA family protein [Sphingobium sp. B11D3D]|uniref:AsmA family protein n=1 Tax=Sphingobium sp. B11D3D TaxID=2940576 RepID=UPI0022240925|nr:AsmA family protein [Sphingobium sp. B11D3D]MCW2368425.1 uncharacterized protein involved in outer membrane biogenesis [Sphingobium sp. B11D3D]
MTVPPHLPPSGDPHPATPRAARRRRPLLWTALAVPLLGWAGLAAGLGTSLLREPIERRASAALGRAVAIEGDVRLLVTPFSLQLAADDVRIANAGWAQAPDLLNVRALTARFSTFDLLIGRSGPRALGLRGGTLDLERQASTGAANWKLGGRDGPFAVAGVQRVDADDVVLRYRDERDGIESWLKLVGSGPGAVRFAGRASLAGDAFRMSGSSNSAEGQPFRFALRAGAETLDLRLEGESDSPFRLAGADLRVAARGPDLAALAALARIDLPAGPSFSLTARLAQRRGGWHFSRIAGQIGETDLSGSLTLDQRGARPRVVASLASEALHLADGMAVLGLRTATSPSDGEGPQPVASLLPDATLSPGALRSFDAVVDYKAEQIEGVGDAGSALKAAHLAMRLALIDGRFMLSPASVDLAGGFVSSDIYIDARQGPALARYDIRLSPTPMGPLLAGWGLAPRETTALARGRIQLSGRGETLRETLGHADGRIALVLPAGRVGMARASASELDMTNLRAAMFGTRSGNGVDSAGGIFWRLGQRLGIGGDGEAADNATRLNCGLIAFSVRDGLATADPILIDTDGHVLTGRGEFDLRGERLDLRLQAQGKSREWFGRPSPILIGGTLAAPTVLREPVDLFRPQRLFGLSMMLPDVRAIFGFVDPDEAQAPACGTLLRGGATADAAAAGPAPKPAELALR